MTNEPAEAVDEAPPEPIPPCQLMVDVPGRVRRDSQEFLKIRMSKAMLALHASIDLSAKSSTLDLCHDMNLGIRQDSHEDLAFFTPSKDGHHEIQFKVVAKESGGSSWWEGRLRIRVESVADGRSQLTIVDQRVISHGAVAVGDGPVIPENFGAAPPPQEAVESRQLFEVSLRPLIRKRIIFRADIRDYNARRLSLHVQQSDGWHNICLVAGGRATLGRSYKTNDIALMLWPKCDEKWINISRQHACIELNDDGAFWRNLNCEFGVEVGKRFYGANQSAVIRKDEVISPASALPLTCHVDEFDMNQVAQDYQLLERRHAIDVGVWPAKLRAVRLEREAQIDKEKHEKYVIFDRVATIGCLPNSTVCIAGPRVAGTHARIVWLANKFFLEPLQKTHPTYMDEVQILPDELFPLAPDVNIRLGEVEITVKDFYQKVH